MEARGGMPRRVRDRALFPNKAPDHVIPLALAQSHQRGKNLHARVGADRPLIDESRGTKFHGSRTVNNPRCASAFKV